MSQFQLDPRLEADSHLVATGLLSELRLMDDARFDWLVLVPRVHGASELIDLDAPSQAILLREINQCCQLLQAFTPCDKLNVGALGNIVRQLHVHVLARLETDAAWPGPAWGAGIRQPLSADARERRLGIFRSQLPADGWQMP
jgi:diadenosine tetraphosphate (Ap4A) HIT family hydrolase